MWYWMDLNWSTMHDPIGGLEFWRWGIVWWDSRFWYHCRTPFSSKETNASWLWETKILDMKSDAYQILVETLWSQMTSKPRANSIGRHPLIVLIYNLCPSTWTILSSKHQTRVWSWRFQFIFSELNQCFSQQKQYAFRLCRNYNLNEILLSGFTSQPIHNNLCQSPKSPLLAKALDKSEGDVNYHASRFTVFSD